MIMSRNGLVGRCRPRAEGKQANAAHDGADVAVEADRQDDPTSFERCHVGVHAEPQTIRREPDRGIARVVDGVDRR